MAEAKNSAEAANKELQEGLANYQRSLEQSRALVEADRGNSRWQSDLAVSYGKIGGIYFDQAQYPQAYANYAQGSALAAQLVQRDQTFLKWQTLRAFFLGSLGRVALRTGDFTAAREKLTSAADTLAALAKEKKLGPDEANWLADFEADRASLPPP